MTIRTFVRFAASLVLTSLLAACGGGGHFTPASDTSTDYQPAQQALQQETQTSAVQTNALTPSSLPVTSFLPSSYGKIGTFQIFDETRNGTISATAAQQHGYHYNAVWGVRPGMATNWRVSNSGLQASYYFISITDASTSAWGGIGHSLTWWKANHPSWILYACSTSTNAPTHNPAYVAGLPNVPIDFHNTAAADYVIRNVVAPYAKSHGYNALAADEVTFWPAMSGTTYYPCGIWNGSTFVRRYSNANDPRYDSDMVNWVKAAHSTLRTYFPGMRLIVNHPGSVLSTNEETLLQNVDAVMDETGFTAYGRYQIPVSKVTAKANWMRYGQQHGVAMLINQDWGAITMGAAQRDYSVATYLLGNEQAAAAFISNHSGYGIEVWRSEYGMNVGAPCGEYYSGGGALLYRKFANAFVAVNGGGSGTQSAHLPTGHTYVDLEGRTVHNPLPIAANDGYVLKTTNGCN